MYITKLPKAEHDAPEWQAAMEALLLVAESGSPTMFAGIMRALNRQAERVFNPDRKDPRWGRPARPSTKLEARRRLLSEYAPQNHPFSSPSGCRNQTDPRPTPHAL
jgi:hypothetical protein